MLKLREPDIVMNSSSFTLADSDGGFFVVLTSLEMAFGKRDEIGHAFLVAGGNVELSLQPLCQQICAAQPTTYPAGRNVTGRHRFQRFHERVNIRLNR